uniref:RNA-directed DNA polymerase n=1 Tax=Sipha flava TaxID=143950 RepID=A0A2S2QL03_9HEMI
MLVVHVVESDLLYELRDHKKLLVVPRGMHREIIQNAHGVGHFGVKKVVELLNREYSISNVEERVKRFIVNCVPCILINRKSGRQEGFLHTIDKGDVPLDTWHIDFLGPLSSTARGYKHIFAIVDAFTKFCWLFPTKSTTSSEVISKLHLLQGTFGNPRRIVSDRGAAFTSQDFKEYCETSNIQHVPITIGMPRGNGQVERINDIIATSIAKLSIDEPEKWFEHVPKVQMALNCSWQRSINMTPFS